MIPLTPRLEDPTHHRTREEWDKVIADLHAANLALDNGPYDPDLGSKRQAISYDILQAEDHRRSVRTYILTESDIMGLREKGEILLSWDVDPRFTVEHFEAASCLGGTIQFWPRGTSNDILLEGEAWYNVTRGPWGADGTLYNEFPYSGGAILTRVFALPDGNGYKLHAILRTVACQKYMDACGDSETGAVALSERSRILSHIQKALDSIDTGDTASDMKSKIENAIRQIEHDEHWL